MGYTANLPMSFCIIFHEPLRKVKFPETHWSGVVSFIGTFLLVGAMVFTETLGTLETNSKWVCPWNFKNGFFRGSFPKLGQKMPIFRGELLRGSGSIRTIAISKELTAPGHAPNTSPPAAPSVMRLGIHPFPRNESKTERYYNVNWLVACWGPKHCFIYINLAKL